MEVQEEVELMMKKFRSGEKRGVLFFLGFNEMTVFWQANVKQVIMN